jgi:hypothetical protein
VREEQGLRPLLAVHTVSSTWRLAQSLQPVPSIWASAGIIDARSDTAEALPTISKTAFFCGAQLAGHQSDARPAACGEAAHSGLAGVPADVLARHPCGRLGKAREADSSA